MSNNDFKEKITGISDEFEVNDILDSAELQDNILEEPVDIEEENIIKPNTEFSFNVPTIFSQEEVDEAVKKKQENNKEKVQHFLDNILQNEMYKYQEEHGKMMDGKTKRRTKRRIEQLYKKGKIKMADFSQFN